MLYHFNPSILFVGNSWQKIAARQAYNASQHMCAHPHYPRPTQLSNPGYATGVRQCISFYWGDVLLTVCDSVDVVVQHWHVQAADQFPGPFELTSFCWCVTLSVTKCRYVPVLFQPD